MAEEFLIPGIIAGVVVFFALLGILILFVEDIDTRISIGLILLIIALTVAFMYFSTVTPVLFIPACIGIAIIVALIIDKVIESLSVV